MNVRNKVISVVMSFVIIFCTVSNSFCNDKEYIIDNKGTRSALTLGGLVVTKEAFNIIVGVAGACGVALLTYDDKFSFVDEFFSYYSDLKVDSGEFTTNPVKHFEEEIKKDTKKPSNDNGDNNNLIVGSSLVAMICSVFDNMFKDKPNKYKVYDSIPTSPNYAECYSKRFDMVKGDIVKYNLPGEDTVNFRYDGYNFDYRLNSPLNDDPYYYGTRNTIHKKPCKGSKCVGNGKPGYYHLYVSSVGAANPGTGGNILYYTDPSLGYRDFCYYFEGEVDKTHYIPGLKDTTVSNDDVVGSYPGVDVEGSLDIPSGSAPGGSAPGGSDIDFELPPVPGFDDEGMDLSFISDLFEHLKGKFPFSIPFDLYNIVDVLRAEPVAPVFDVNFLGNTLTLDLTQFDEWANIVRAFSVFSWVFVLFTFTKKLGG